MSDAGGEPVLVDLYKIKVSTLAPLPEAVTRWGGFPVLPSGLLLSPCGHSGPGEKESASKRANQ